MAQSVKQWLASIELEEYYSTFIDNGYDNVKFIKNITNDQQLKDIGIKKPGHIIHILRSLQNTQQQQQTDQKQEEEESSKISKNQISIKPCPTNSRTYFQKDISLNGPRNVKVFFKINMVYQVDSVSTTVDLDFNIYQQWIDPAMINAVKSHGFTRTAAEYEQLCWTPNLEINNNVSLQPLWDGNTCWNLKDESLGLMQYSQRYKGTISNKMYLHFFPFDSNVIEINVGPKYYNLNQIDIETNVKEQNKINESRNCIIPSNL